MNLLIVDDQPNILSALANTIDWKKYGIYAVYTASSVLTAKNLIETKEIQILLSDIEMPMESGLNLVRWIRQKNLNIECILLTSHADFIYAKQAISLGVVDYILQPAKNEDVILSVINAKERIQKNNELHKKLQISHFSTLEINSIRRRFFENWPDNTKDAAFEQLLQERITKLNELGISCAKDSPCIIFTTRINTWSALPPAITILLNHYETILTNIFSFINGKQLSFYLDDSHFITILLLPTSVDLYDYFTILAAKLDQELHCIVSIYYAQTTLPQLNLAYRYMSNTEDLFDSNGTSFIQRIHLPENDMANDQNPQSYQKYFKQIEAFIAENMQLPISRAEIASAIHVSPDYVSHIVRSVAGCSCKGLITREKMKYAKKLIKTTDQPIGNIASECGYDSFAYFSKIYKSINQVSPSQDRNNR